MKRKRLASFPGLVLPGLALAVVSGSWWWLVRQGRRFALRDRLRRMDAMVVLAGTLGWTLVLYCATSHGELLLMKKKPPGRSFTTGDLLLVENAWSHGDGTVSR